MEEQFWTEGKRGRCRKRGGEREREIKGATDVWSVHLSQLDSMPSKFSCHKMLNHFLKAKTDIRIIISCQKSEERSFWWWCEKRGSASWGRRGSEWCGTVQQWNLLLIISTCGSNKNHNVMFVFHFGLWINPLFFWFIISCKSVYYNNQSLPIHGGWVCSTWCLPIHTSQKRHMPPNHHIISPVYSWGEDYGFKKGKMMTPRVELNQDTLRDRTFAQVIMMSRIGKRMRRWWGHTLYVILHHQNQEKREPLFQWIDWLFVPWLSSSGG